MKDEPGMISPYLKLNPREALLMKGVGEWPYERRCLWLCMEMSS